MWVVRSIFYFANVDEAAESIPVFAERDKLRWGPGRDSHEIATIGLIGHCQAGPSSAWCRKITGRLFGTGQAASDAGKEVALRNGIGTVQIYSLATARQIETLTFGKPLAYYTFSADGSELFAVTEDQTVYLLNLSESKAN
ncbi:MAG TPA: hypothetical protein VGU63_08780 [Candidatus Acidoferrales bacterium]|nr:hypothetical protein [Candidatus Acidoferrales bacterium]